VARLVCREADRRMDALAGGGTDGGVGAT
jgi:hypothetical protein